MEKKIEEQRERFFVYIAASTIAGLHAQNWLIYKYRLKFINWQINRKIKIGLYVIL